MGDLALVTGATGCLGSALTRRLLSDGTDVAVLKRPHDPLGALAASADRLDVRTGDVTDPESLAAVLKGVDRVYHLAGVVAPLNRLSDAMWRVNVVGSYNVAKAARAAGVRMVHVSSTASIGYPADGVLADEDFDPADSVADNAYATTKRHGERLVRDVGDDGLDLVVVNPSAVFAPGGDPRYAWSRFVKAGRYGVLRAMPVGGTAVCAVRDFVDGAVKAMQSGRSGSRYILSTANLRYTDLARQILRCYRHQNTVLTVPALPLRAAGQVNERVARLFRDPEKSSLLVPENVELMTRRLFYDQRRAVTELGMSQTAIEDMIADMMVDPRSSGRSNVVDSVGTVR